MNVYNILGVSFCLSESVSNNFSQTLKGDFLMMIGVIAASCFTVFSGKYLKKYGNIPVMIYVMGTGTLINFLITLIFGSSFENEIYFVFRKSAFKSARSNILSVATIFAVTSLFLYLTFG